MKVKFLRRLTGLFLSLTLIAAAIFACFKNVSNFENAPDLIPNTLAVQTVRALEDINLINLEIITKASDIPANTTEFKINSAEGIKNFRNLVNNTNPDERISFENKIIYLTDDIIVPFSVEFPFHTPIGTSLNPFKGIFDGCGFTIGLIDIYAAGSHGGLFGTTDGAIIKNLNIGNGKESSPIENISGCEYLGAIAGNAINTTIINCVNKADITNSTATGSAAGIAANADRNSKIINCINYGTISAANASGITSSSQCEVSLCTDFLSTFETDKNWTDLSPAEKEEYIATLNTGIHSKRDELYNEMLSKIAEEEREYNYSKRLYLFYWGFDVEDTKYLALCFSNSYIDYMNQKGIQVKAGKYEEDGDTIYNGVVPLLDLQIMAEFLSKNVAVSSLTMWFTDSYLFITGTDDFSAEKRNELLEKYFELLERLADLSISKYGSGNNGVYSFMVAVEQFVKNACEEIDDIFFEWEKAYEKQYKDKIYFFALSLMTSWYNNSYNFIYGDDDLSRNARIELENEYKNCLKVLNGIVYETEYSDNTELFTAIRQAVNNSYDTLHNVFYGWEINSYENELKAAYDNILKTVSPKNKEKINQIKTEADARIAAALIKFDKANAAGGTDRINNWIIYTNNVEEAVYEAVAEFNSLEQEWRSQGKTTLWISISGGLLLLAALTVVALLLILQKKQKQFNAIIFEAEDKTDRKTKKYSEIAERISRENELQRAKAEQQAKLYRKQAEQALLEKQKPQILSNEQKPQILSDETNEQEFLYDEPLQPQKIKSKEKKRSTKKDEDIKE